MIAYKFLRCRRIGPFSGYEWPVPGVWVRPSATDACRRGVHACRTGDLPWWLSDELWEIELNGQVRVDEHKIIAPAGRLRARVDGWTPACAQQYADACAWRARDHATEALARAGHAAASRNLAACATLPALAESAPRLALKVPSARIIVTIAGDGAYRAVTGAPPTAAYIAAHAALRLDGPAGYAAERAWQSRWLVQRLGLTEVA